MASRAQELADQREPAAVAEAVMELQPPTARRLAALLAAARADQRTAS
jgi:hypothetical protein